MRSGPQPSTHLPALAWRLITVAALATLLAACGKGPTSTGTTGPVRQLKASDLTPAERKYGVAPTPDPSVKYQPDVVIVGGGAESIRGQSDNGFVWTLDANAKHADELVEGKVMFVTGRALGRVLAVRRSGDNLQVFVGPVDLTDVVREADIRIQGMPLDFDEALQYSLKDPPSRAIPLAEATAPDTAHAIPAMLKRVANTLGPPPPEPGWDVTKLLNFIPVQIVGTSGIGLRVASDAGDLKMHGQVWMALEKPTLDVTITIRPSGVTEAFVKIGGTAGLKWRFGVGTEVGRSANVQGIVEPDSETNIPLGGFGLPIAVNVRQRLLIKTALGARNSTLTATGEYAFTGALKAGYFGGRWDIAGPTNIKATNNLLANSGGVSIAAGGVNMTHVMRVTVGFGAAGFTVGPYVSFTSALGLFKGSDLGMIPCREATLVMSMRGGVGYTMPKVIAKLINSFLSFVGIRHNIQAEGSLAPSPSVELYNDTKTLPGCRAGPS
jgi:hypothetical protein